MCGILGILNRDGRAVEASDLSAMGERLKHRGPDGSGYYIDGPLGLGQTRLAVIDVEGGKQPIFNEDKTVSVVFNGEIYNFLQLRQELEKEGHHFYTRTDTEVIVHLYESRGVRCVESLRGMFAFALWDSRRRTLFMARDHLGKKPLYYCLLSDRLIFGSELKALFAVKGVERKLRASALDAYLGYQFVPDPMTAFRGIQKLPPGTSAVYADGALRLQRYWVPPLPSEGGSREQMEETARIFSEAVRLRLVSDVPLGAFLSGGIDSSLVVAQMAGMLERPVQTYSMGFEDPSFDERGYAERVASALGTDHHAALVTCRPEEILPRLIYHFDEPFADSSAIPMYYLSQAARRGVTVALSGDGGDELFAGYRRYVARRLIAYYERIPGPLRRGLISRVERWFPEGTDYYGGSLRKKFRLFLEAYDRYRSAGVLLWSPLFSAEEKKLLYRPQAEKLLDEEGSEDPVLEAVREASSRGLDSISEMLRIDLQTYLPGDILTKVDRMSMAHGLEVRAPFLDVRLVEHVSRIPWTQKLSGLTTKVLLRRIAKDVLPGWVIKRPKQGFAVPLGRWFKGPLREAARNELVRQDGVWGALFRSEYIERLIEEHDRGWRDQSMKLWGLLVLRRWSRDYLEG